MPLWPVTPVPYHVSAPGVLDPVLRMDTDQGYSVRRSRFSRRRRLYQVSYLGTADEIMILLDFIEGTIRGGALSFSWIYPYGQMIASISSATPNLLTTSYRHGLQTGDQVNIAGTVSHNGIFTVTVTGVTTATLTGTAGGSAEGAVGTVAFYLPFASLQLDGDTLPPPEVEHDFGPFRDNDSLTRLTVTIKQEFG